MWGSQDREAESLGKALQAGAGQDAMRHVCVLETATPVLSDEVLTRFPGLLAVQAVRQKARYVQVMFWLSRDHYEHAREELFGQAQVIRVLHQGSASPLVVRKTPAYKRLTVKEWIVSATALYGVIQVFVNHVADVVAMPDAEVRTEQRALSVTQGETHQVDGTIENLLASASLRRVRLSAELQKPDGSPVQKVGMPQEKIASIDAGKDRKFKFELPPSEPGAYKLVVTMHACAGWLFCLWPRPFSKELDLRVFPRLPQGRVQLASKNGKEAELQLVVQTGINLRETAACQVAFAPGPAFRYLSPGLGEPVSFDTRIGDDKLMRAGLRWTVGSRDARQAFGRNFKFAAESPIDWDKVANQAIVKCGKG